MTRPEALARPGSAEGPVVALARAALPVLALGIVTLVVGATLAVAGDTFGYDFLAYHQAAQRVLDGQPLYDTRFERSGEFGLFYYPPAFLPLVLPFGLLDPVTATWAWTALLAVAFAAGIAVLPVPATVRWAVLLLAGLSWPFAYAMKLGQVGPLLFLLFAVGWRRLDHPVGFGAVAALGTAIKLQPALVLVWAVLTRRWLAVTIGGGILLGLSAVATGLAGPAIWTDFLTLVRAVNDPITTERNMTPGSVAYQLGVATGAAEAVQLASTVVVIAALVVALVRSTQVASYLVAVIASQLLSPILWDHYAMLLLLPVAWLLSRGAWWAALIPLATSVLFVGVIPPIAYPTSFFAALVAVLAVGRTGRAVPGA